MKVVVRDVIGGEDAITLDDGQRVYDQVRPALKQGESVDVDFAGVNVFASPFFNAAIGQLLRDLKPEQLNRLLKFANLAPAGLGVLHRVIENAKRYYAEPNYRDAQIEVLRGLSEEP